MTLDPFNVDIFWADSLDFLFDSFPEVVVRLLPFLLFVLFYVFGNFSDSLVDRGVISFDPYMLALFVPFQGMSDRSKFRSVGSLVSSRQGSAYISWAFFVVVYSVTSPGPLFGIGVLAGSVRVD